ncbi:MAG: hypothetical protein UT91_C0037G0007 [Parcubacteria group bacterium GW2011_GWA2_40_23]|nr:MAG: hypothetical protein UT91_C0037G0007 [Parcubacteria group bacterium GW2011_GWA2_40_23]
MILGKLYLGLDGFWQDFNIAAACANCQDPDCVGYVWLLKEEADSLYELGVPIIEINDGPCFIHSFPQALGGGIDFSYRYPPCNQLCQGTRRCSIYENRPLVCRLYPLALEMQPNGMVMWVLHQDCEFVRRQKRLGLLTDFEEVARRVLSRIPQVVLTKLVITYRAVYDISLFPDGPNQTKIIKEAENV